MPEYPKPAHLLVGGGPATNYAAWALDNVLAAIFDALRYALQPMFDSRSLLRYQALGQDLDALLL